jgi:nitrate reductase delta subunit
MDARLFERLAPLFEYPEPDLVGLAEEIRASLAPVHASAAGEVERFAAHVAGCDPREVEELYTRTFDVLAACCLDVGYQLFGETYKRGLFLVRMQEALRRYGVAPGAELPDHLPVVLRLLARLEEKDDPESLAREVLLPAVAKMLLSFGDGANPYAGLLRALSSLLRAAYAPDARVAFSLPVLCDGGAPHA